MKQFNEIKANSVSYVRVLALAGAAALACFSASSHADTVDDYVHTQMASKKIPGMAVAVLRDGQLVKEGVYGLASLELNVPLTADTSFSLASMTKVFTTAAIMVLVQDGKLSLDEPVIKILPQLPPQWAHVTVRHCLSHTSGLPDNVSDDINLTPVAGDRDELFKILATKPLSPAGEQAVYNQTGFTLLGMVIEKLSGVPYEQFMQERVFKPAQLQNARFGDGWAIIPGRSELYTALDITPDHSKLLRDGQGRPVLSKSGIQRYGSKYMPEYLKPAGQLNASLHDLVNWELSLAQGKLLNAGSLTEMTTPYRLKSGQPGEFGLGFLTVPFGPFQTVNYGGGAATWRFSVPEKHLTVLVLTNLQDSQPQVMAAQVAALYAPELAEAEQH
ncbi:MAG: beta-lactamase family protein [Burkholderiaceae bacterium]|nr:beta-lactamase family protein [Burkholderiaceae bacterium]